MPLPPGVTLSPNMSLPIPAAGVTPGPEWLQSVVQCLNIIDQHNHSGPPSEGIQLGSNGIVLTSDLDLSDYGLTSVGSVEFTPAASALLNTLYVDGVDLFYNDGNGNTVQLTNGGVVNATASGISSGTATASFVGSVLVVNAAANTPANIRGASILIGNNVAASNYITISPPNSLAASYQVFWPAALPASTTFMIMDSSGNMTVPLDVTDNSTLQQSGATLSMKDAGTTRAKLAAAGQLLSSSTGSFSTNSASFTDVTNASVSATVTGRPVKVMLVPDGSGTAALVYGGSSSQDPTSTGYYVKLLRDAVEVGRFNTTGALTPGSIAFVDVPVAGTYMYKLQVAAVGVGTGNPVYVQRCKLYVQEDY